MGRAVGTARALVGGSGIAGVCGSGGFRHWLNGLWYWGWGRAMLDIGSVGDHVVGIVRIVLGVLDDRDILPPFQWRKRRDGL